MYHKFKTMKRKERIIILVTLMSFLSYLVYSTILFKKVADIEENVARIEYDSITATMYCPVVGQCDKDPLVTASMRKINPRKASQHKWVAVSRDLLKRWGGKFEYGDKIRIVGCNEKDGVYTVVDCMNRRFKNKIDILETRGTRPYKFKNVKIFAI